MTETAYELLAATGCGSAIVHAALALTGAKAKITDASPYEEGPGKERLRTLNPLLQVPVLVLPEGPVMTESAAMVLLLAERFPDAGLAPAADGPARAEFLRWLVFLVAAIYPTFTFGDDPSRFVSGKAAQDELRRSTEQARMGMWRQVEAAAGAPWFLGDRFSALDLYIAVMTRWRPGQQWFAQSCPKIDAIARNAFELPALGHVWERNFA